MRPAKLVPSVNKLAGEFEPVILWEGKVVTGAGVYFRTERDAREFLKTWPVAVEAERGNARAAEMLR